MEIRCDPHPRLELAAFTCELPTALDALPSPAWLTDLLRADATAPVARSELVRTSVRDLLRHGGFKPTGRSKPASEYLARAAEDGTLAPINLVVDANNAASLHSGLPASVLDLDRLTGPLRVAVAGPGESYVFNPSGQEIDVAGLLCACDDDGACGSPVKDAQRAKTCDATTRAVALVWGCRELADHVAATCRWYRELLARAGIATAACEVVTCS